MPNFEGEPISHYLSLTCSTFTTMAKTIYALLVGINRYQSLSSLYACVNDATNMKNWLEAAAARAGAKLSLLMLTDEQATRSAVTRSFANQLGLAGEGDVALFYFSGHGALEGAHAAFKQTETDNTIETLLCHDFYYVNGFADKELRYLIHKISGKKPHVIIITDTCHSGDSTRHDSQVRVKQVFPASLGLKDGPAFAQRKWNEFLFANEITEAHALAAAGNLDAVLPQGNHIHIAACKANELAVEAGDSGLFTEALLQVLSQTAGNITYQNLFTRTDQLLENNPYTTQTPQIYVVESSTKKPVTEVPAVLYERFLGGLVAGEPVEANITYNAQKGFWQIDKGTLHGLPSIGLDKVTVEVVSDKDKSVFARANLKAVFPDYAQIEFPASVSVYSTDTYGAFVREVFTTPLLFATGGDEQGKQILQQYYTDNSKSLKKANIVPTPRGNALNIYKITAKDNTFELSFNNLPVAKQSDGYTKASANAVFGYLKHIARWQYVKKFKNTVAATQLQSSDVRLKLFYQTPAGTLAETAFNEQFTGKASYAQIPPAGSLTQSPTGSIKIALTNQSATTAYYCALAYLGQLYDIVTDTFPGGVVQIAPKTTVYATVAMPNGKRAEDIPLIQDAYIEQYNYPESFFGLLLLCSVQPFSVESFAQEALPAPKTGIRNEETAPPADREPPQTPQKWQAVYYEVKIPNPYFTTQL